LQQTDAVDDLTGVLKFAAKHRMIVLCWGSRNLWEGGKSWYDLDRTKLAEQDRVFNAAANAWAKGVDELSKRYGIPRNGFFLCGHSASAQYALRLALRKPDYFHAAHIHIPATYDKPTPEARSILWCLTTGELDYGYPGSIKFLKACRALGYPIIHKAIIGMGHTSHPATTELGMRFFEYALEVRKEREAFNKEIANPFSATTKQWRDNPNQAWPKSFREPVAIGDTVNQEVFSPKDIDMAPEGFRVMLPSKLIADAWKISE
jgi:predicted esterase